MTVSINGRYSHDYKNGVLVKETLNPANETVARGHYAATTLSTVDADLATANIKNGITLFGFAGSADVFDISDADLVEAEAPTGKFFYAVSGGRRTGTGTKTLSDANDVVAAGYYAATNLSTVDEHLASINIKAGVTIFGFAGDANVVDTSSGDAIATDIKDGKKAWVDGAEVTGSMATRTLNPANEDVLEGFYAATTLSAVDAQLAAANILSGVNIFGFVGVATVQDIADADLAVAEAPTGKFFYAVTGGRKTGTGTKTLNAANETVAAGYYGATTLSAVDVHLAVGNIKLGVNIFGFVGTLAAGPIVHDVQGSDVDAQDSSASWTIYREVVGILAGGDVVLLTVTIDCDQATVIEAAYFVSAYCDSGITVKLQMYIDGVAQGETGFLTGEFRLYSDIGNKAVASGNRIVYLNAHDHETWPTDIYFTGGIHAGCGKL